jgi:hypothetical protein
MSITSILIIVGCVVAGYWIVSSVMGPGIDMGEEGRKAETKKAPRPGPASARPTASRPALPTANQAPMRDWYIVLDVSPDASRAEIQAALKRRLAQAESAGDIDGLARIARAAEVGLAQRR